MGTAPLGLQWRSEPGARQKLKKLGVNCFSFPVRERTSWSQSRYCHGAPWQSHKADPDSPTNSMFPASGDTVERLLVEWNLLLRFEWNLNHLRIIFLAGAPRPHVLLEGILPKKPSQLGPKNRHRKSGTEKKKQKKKHGKMW